MGFPTPESSISGRITTDRTQTDTYPLLLTRVLIVKYFFFQFLGAHKYHKKIKHHFKKKKIPNIYEISTCAKYHADSIKETN